MQPVKTKKKLSRADKKQIEAAIARANRTDKTQNEDKTAIFEGWCDFLNYFDSSIHLSSETHRKLKQIAMATGFGMHNIANNILEDI